MPTRLYFIFTLFLFAACIGQRKSNEMVYQSAIQKAMYPATNTADTSLINISASNPALQWKKIGGQDYALVVTWKAKKYYPDSGAYNTGSWSPIWVTTAPELQQRMKKEKYSDVNLRLKQLLGLPPTAQYSFFYELWVRPRDLFRPCPDKEITDRSCNICFSHTDSLDKSYVNWINNTRIERYYACGVYNQYPWTQLGYTFDWNPKNKTHIGLCEFVIQQNSNVFVKKVYNTGEYVGQ